MSDIIIYPESLCASVIGKELSAKTPTELYVAVMTEILKNRPQIIGQKETHFTTDSVRAGQYTGTTREVYVNNTKVYIKTGFSTKDKWKGIEKICQLVGLTFEVSYEEPSESVGDIFGFDDDFFADFGVSPNPFQETSSTEPFVPTSPFAFHSEYYVGERTLGYYDSHISCAKFDDMVYCDGRIYATEESIYGYRFFGGNTVFEILPGDWSIRAIVSENKYFTGDIAVNKNGIFRIDGNKFYLFDMNGKMKSKITIKPTRPSGMYIYDSRIYSLSAKGKVYEYDILNPDSEKVIWNISDIRGRLDDAVASYVLDNNFERRYNNQRIQISIPWLTPKRICANDKRIVVGFELDLSSKQLYVSRNKFMLYVSIDTQNYKWNIIDVSDTRADYKVFSFDMEKDIMWWWTGDNKSRYLFSTEIKPLDSAVRRNPQYSYHLFSDFNGHSVLSCFLSCNSYFDGKSASGNTNMDTVYICADGTSEGHSTSSQCYAGYVLGNWMYRPNMFSGDGKYFCFMPHSKEAFVNYSSWHKITSEEFERAYQKAIGK